MFNLTGIQLGVIAALVVAIPLAFFGGRWHQSRIDDVKWQVAVEASRSAAEKAAGEAVALAATQVAAAEEEASLARAQAEEEGRKAEEAEAARDEETRKNVPTSCPDPTRAGTNELQRLRALYPAGPIAKPKVRRGTN